MDPIERDDVQAIRHELEALRAEVRSGRSAGGRSWWTRATNRQSMAKRLTRVGLLALMLAMPVVVSASHQFTDVPTSHTFHSAISKLYGARITTGCTATKFCPNANVTRGQMAAFLNRGLGRAAGNSEPEGFVEWDVFDRFGFLSTVDLTHGGALGGTGHALVMASVSAYTEQVDLCPCEMRVWLIDVDSGVPSPVMRAPISSEPAPAVGLRPPHYETSTAISYLFTVPSGGVHTYKLAAEMTTTGTRFWLATTSVEFSLSALYVPFGADGGNP